MKSTVFIIDNHILVEYGGPGGNVAIPDGVTVIDGQAFRGCDRLTGVAIPDSVTEIRRFAFAECHSLKNVSIPEGVDWIGCCAFWNCTGLESVSIPASLTGIEDDAFLDCDRLEDVAYAGTMEQWEKIEMDDATRRKLETAMRPADDEAGSAGFVIRDGVLVKYNGPSGDVAIPCGVTGIGLYAFHGCHRLKSVKIPDGVREIGVNAFDGCRVLSSITVPASVSTIKFNAFQDCPALADVRYEGTREQWSRILIRDGNSDLLAASMHFAGDAAETGPGAAKLKIRVIDGEKYVRLDDLGVLGKIAEIYAGMRQD